jgi:hypothetical protein
VLSLAQRRFAGWQPFLDVGVVMLDYSGIASLIQLSCSWALAAAHKHLGWVSSPSLCRYHSHCNLHLPLHARDHDPHASLCAHAHQLSALCSNLARCHYRLRSQS